MNKSYLFFLLILLLIMLLITSCIPQAKLFCGDSKCTEGENSQSCPQDCGCSNGYYLAGNTCIPKCGDGIKTNEETSNNCCLDAGCSTGYRCEQNKCIELLPKLDATFSQTNTKSVTYFKAKNRDIGTLTISNSGNSLAKNIRVKLTSPDSYIDQQIIDFGNINEGNQQSKSISLAFTDKSLEISSETSLNLNVDMLFQDEDNKEHSDSETIDFKMMGRNFMDWRNSNEISLWITPNHPSIKEFASKATAGIAASSSVGNTENQALAARWLLESMRAYGIRYVNDPFNKQGDYVQFPTETLINKAGDCEDNAVLYASLLAAVGMEPVIILTPGHAFSGYINKDGKLVPIETTSLDFDTASISGLNEVKQNQGNIEIIHLDWADNPQVILPVNHDLKLPSITKEIGECGVSFNLQDLFVASVPVTFTNSGEAPGAGCAAVSIYEENKNLRDEKIGCWAINPGETKTLNFQPDISVFRGYYCLAQ